MKLKYRFFLVNKVCECHLNKIRLSGRPHKSKNLVTIEFIFRRHIASHAGNSEHSIAAKFTSGLVRESHRRVDEFVFGFRVSLTDGVRHRQQLHGTGRDEIDERIFGRGFADGRRFQDWGASAVAAAV